eukprot:1206400-Amphidinium_carterae.1
MTILNGVRKIFESHTKRQTEKLQGTGNSNSLNRAAPTSSLSRLAIAKRRSPMQEKCTFGRHRIVSGTNYDDADDDADDDDADDDDDNDDADDDDADADDDDHVDDDDDDADDDKLRRSYPRLVVPSFVFCALCLLREDHDQYFYYLGSLLGMALACILVCLLLVEHASALCPMFCFGWGASGCRSSPLEALGPRLLTMRSKNTTLPNESLRK